MHTIPANHAVPLTRRAARSEPAPPLVSRSPWDTDDLVASCPAADAAAVGAAVADMAAAFPGWARHQQRSDRLARLRAVLAARRRDIVALLVREAGKTIADAGVEADQLTQTIDVALPHALAETTTVAATSGALCCWRPRGVAAVITPFNYPLRLLHGLVVPALAVGCPVVAKPSERTPALGALYAELLDEAGLDEVCRVVLGGPATAVALAARPGVATVAAIGGRAMGVALARAVADRPETALALELGGMGQALVLDDADDEAAAAAIAAGAWRCAGQRCTALRVVHVLRDRVERWCELLAAARAAWRPTRHPDGPVGPMIGVDDRERFQRPYRALPPGVRLIAGSPVNDDDRDALADPLLLRILHPAARTLPLLRGERFGPVLTVDAYDDLDECLARLAAQPYRLAAGVFTRDPTRFMAVAARLPYGLVHHDRAPGGGAGDLPFGGTGLSGNGRPMAAAACRIFADECVVCPR